jgi:hypothetical protein
VENIFGGEPADSTHMSISRNPKTGKATVCESRHIKGRFFELMELDKFPFDVQVRFS